MIHFLWSIFFLVLVTLLVLAYMVAGIFFSWFAISVAYVVWRVFFYLFMRIMVMEKITLHLNRPLYWLKNINDKLFNSQNKPQNRRVVYSLLVFVVVVNLGIYVNEYRQWHGADNAHPDAKQYFVAGQVVYFHRRFMSMFLSHPDKYSLMAPFNVLQKMIYKRGIRLLPEKDVEKAVWADLWFVYIYSRNNKLPYKVFSDRELGYSEFRGTDGRIITKDEALRGEVPLQPKKNEFMDLVWFCLKTMATKTFADQEMKEHHYLRNFAGEAQYYAYNASRAYTKKRVNSQHFYAQMPAMTRRNEQLVLWLRALPDKWRQSATVHSFINKHPKVDAMRQMGLIMSLVDIFDGRIWARRFSCNDPYLHYLREAREEFVHGREGKEPSWKRMAGRSTAKQFYTIAINSDMARFTNFITERKCGEALPGEEDMREFQGESISPEDSRKEEIRNLFHYELKLLGMTDVLEEKYWTNTVHGYEYR